MAPARRLEDRIRELGSRIAAAKNGELGTLVSQLQSALNEFTLRINNKSSATVLAWPEYPRERRKA